MFVEDSSGKRVHRPERIRPPLGVEAMPYFMVRHTEGHELTAKNQTALSECNLEDPSG